MHDHDKTIYDEIRRWAREMLQKPRIGAGKASLNRSLIGQLERCHVPEEFIALVARQLGVDTKVRNGPRLKRQQMAVAAALAYDPKLSDKKLARDFGVSRPTIALWKKQPSFQLLRGRFESDASNFELFTSQMDFAEFQEREFIAGLKENTPWPPHES